MAAVTIKNYQVIIDAVRDITSKQKEAFTQAIADAQQEIKDRTKAGRDVDGNAFAAYTEEYNRYKQRYKSGYVTSRGKPGKFAKEVKGKFSAIPLDPDLELTGTMWKFLTHEITEDGEKLKARIFFNDPKQAAKAHGNLQKRQFFGLSEDQLQRITDRMKGAR